MEDENLSTSKKRKMIKELRKKQIIINYDYYKNLKKLLNDILKEKNLEEKNTYIKHMYLKLKKLNIKEMIRTNLGFHIITALIINANENIKKKLWLKIFKYINDVSYFHFVSFIFQYFYKYGTMEIKIEIINWLLKNPKSFITKFGSRLWHNIFNKLKNNEKNKIMYVLLFNNLKNYEKNTNFNNEYNKEYYNNLNDKNKEEIKKNIMELIDNCIEKELLYNLVVHNILLFACEIFNKEEKEKLMEMIHQGCEYLLTSNIGNKALIILLGYSTSKHKKLLIKTMKNEINDMCKNSVNFLMIIRLLKITDDTKILNKFIVKNIVQNFEELFNDYYGFYVIMEFFYDLNDYEKDKYLNVVWKQIIYYESINSLKCPNKRKNEIIVSIIEKLYILFKNKERLKKYLKELKYNIILYEYMLYTFNIEILKNLFTIINDYIYKDIKEECENENIILENTIKLFIKLFSYKLDDENKILLCKIDETNFFYEYVCESFISNMEIILKTKLIILLNIILLFIKNKDKKLFNKFLIQSKKIGDEKIYIKLKNQNLPLTQFEKYREIIKDNIY